MMVLDVASGKQYFLMINSSLQIVTWLSWYRISDIFELQNEGIQSGFIASNQLQSNHRFGLPYAPPASSSQHPCHPLDASDHLTGKGRLQASCTIHIHSALFETIEGLPEAVGLQFDKEGDIEDGLELPRQSCEYLLSFEVGGDVGQEQQPRSDLPLVENSNPLANVPLAGTLLREVEYATGRGQQLQVDRHRTAYHTVSGEVVDLDGRRRHRRQQLHVDVDLEVQLLLVQFEEAEQVRLVTAVVADEVDHSGVRRPRLQRATHILILQTWIGNHFEQAPSQTANLPSPLPSAFQILQAKQAMNLIDLYGDPSRGREEESFTFAPTPAERKQAGVPLLLFSLRERLQAQHPRDHVAVLNCETLTAHPRLACDYVLQFLEGRPSRGEFQFHFEVSFSPALNLLTIRGNYLRNGLFLHLSSREQQLMALRMAANLNPALSPLKLTVNAASGELLLEHSSFIDAALADLKFKRNLTSLTFRVTFILELLMKYKYLLLYYAGHSHVLAPNDLPFKVLQLAEARMAAVEGSLREVCLKAYDKDERVNPAVRGELIKHNSLHLSDDLERILQVLAPPQHRPTPTFSQLANEEYSRNDLNAVATKQDEKFDFRVSLKVEVGQNADCQREEVGGNGIVFSVVTRFRVLDEQHLRRHPQAVHAHYEERLAKKIDKNAEKESKVARELEVIGLLGESSHPNLPTFFVEGRPRQQCLLTLWEENLSLQHYLKKQPVSMYHLLFMLQQAAKGLYFLHRHGVVHCDFKPANLILCRRFLVRLIDFGEAQTPTARRARPGRTFPFAGPQAYTKGPITPALDVYSLGVTIYKCLFGGFMWGRLLKKLKNSEGQEEVLPWILPERFRDAGEQKVALAMACLSLKCTAHDPEERPLLPWIITILQESRTYLGQLYYR